MVTVSWTVSKLRERERVKYIRQVRERRKSRSLKSAHEMSISRFISLTENKILMRRNSKDDLPSIILSLLFLFLCFLCGFPFAFSLSKSEFQFFLLFLSFSFSLSLSSGNKMLLITFSLRSFYHLFSVWTIFTLGRESHSF